MAEAAFDAGFRVNGYSNQSNFLIGSGLTELCQQQDESSLQNNTNWALFNQSAWFDPNAQAAQGQYRGWDLSLAYDERRETWGGSIEPRSTWKGFVHYLVIKFPLDTILWSVAVSFLAITLDLLLAPALHQYVWFHDDGVNRWLLEIFEDVYVLPFLGIIWGMISLHVIRGLAWVAGEINTVMLGD